MANDFYELTFRLDTPHASNLMKETVGRVVGVHFPNVLKVKGVKWVSPTATAGDACLILNTEGKPYFDEVASGANYVASDLVERDWQRDFTLTTLASGRVYIYLQSGVF